jgi:hypothetical protein
MKNRALGLLLQYAQIFQKYLFPQLEQELGPLGDKHRQVVKILGLVNLEAGLGWRGRRVGRRPHSRLSLARAFVAKAVMNLPATRDLIERLKVDEALRRICGWERASQIPDESTFSRAFADFSSSQLPQRVHECLIERFEKDRLVGHISRDSTAIAARESVKRAKAVPAKLPQPTPARKRKRGEPKPAAQMTRIERQASGMSLTEMLADLPRECAVGAKTNSQGRKETWRGYKLHLDVADGQIPISAILTSASLHDSQVAIPLATITAQRVTNLYDIMDSAYDCQQIAEHSRKLNHVPIIERLKRGQGLVPMLPHQAARYRERTASERVNSRLKDEFGGRFFRVRGPIKIMAHLMFGLLALSADQLLRCCS